MSNIEYISGGIELLDQVQPLWESLKLHHKENSKNFTKNLEKLTFEVRKRKFIDTPSLLVKIDLVKDKEKNLYVGYCISTVNNELTGEIDSLYLDRSYRKLGIGETLMNRAIDWLNSKPVKKKIIGVAEGNEKVFTFYERFGFYKRTTILESKE